MLHFKPFDKTFNSEFIKGPFLETVKIKIVISLVTTSGNIDFDFTEKSQYFIGEHIRKRFLNEINNENNIIFVISLFRKGALTVVGM